MKRFRCANCGMDITGDVYVCCDNFLQLKYFEDNKLNRFCNQSCFAEFLMLYPLEQEDIPLDDDETEEDDDDSFSLAAGGEKDAL